MATKRSYKQNCALAHALDLVGERWTLLIVRELLISSRRYGELLENLPGMGTNLLATRLKEMVAAELIVKEDSAYRLTDKGRGLEPVIHALVRFALPLGTTGTVGYLHRSEWDCVALAALYDQARDTGLDGSYVLELDDVPYTVDKSADRVSVSPGSRSDVLAHITLSKRTARRLGSGETSFNKAMNAGELSVAGKKAEARKLLHAFNLL